MISISLLTLGEILYLVSDFLTYFFIAYSLFSFFYLAENTYNNMVIDTCEYCPQSSTFISLNSFINLMFESKSDQIVESCLKQPAPDDLEQFNFKVEEWVYKQK